MHHVSTGLRVQMRRLCAPCIRADASRTVYTHAGLRMVASSDRSAALDWSKAASLAMNRTLRQCDNGARSDLVHLVRCVRASDARAADIAQLCRSHILQGTLPPPAARPELYSLALCVAAHESDSVFHAWQQMRALYPAWIPHRDDASWALQSLLATRQCDDAWLLWNDVRALDVLPRAGAINALLASLHTQPEATQLLVELGVRQLDVVGLSTFVHAHVKECMLSRHTIDAVVHEAADELQKRLASSHDAIAWHTILLYEGHVNGPDAALARAEAALTRLAFLPDSYTVSTLFQCYDPTHLTTCDEALSVLQRIHATVGVQPTAHALSMAIHAVLGHGHHHSLGSVTSDPQQVSEASALYKEARSLWSMEPDPALLQPLIEAHCAAFVPALDQACLLLQEYLSEDTDSWMSTSRTSLLARFRPRKPRQRQVDLGLFYPLIIACARLQDVTRALDVLDQLAQRRVRVPPHATITMTKRLLSACSTYDDAWLVYHRAHALGGWTHDTYARLVAFLCRLVLDGESAPPELPLQVLADMRGAGFHPSPSTYTILLDFYAKTHATLAGVRATHELIQRDMHLEPDLVLIHALMNAYNYAGAPAQVLGIWDSLMVLCHNAGAPRFLDDVTVTIVCDTCGRAGLLGVMREILATVRRQYAHLMTKTVYDAWTECLARCGHLTEAVDVVVQDMCAHTPIYPDKKTVQTLLKFARNDDAHGAEAVQRLEAAVPELVTQASLA